jgi:hypothetical protein
MSAKPTPGGPYMIVHGEMKKASGPVVCNDDCDAVAIFLTLNVSEEQAEANARAWVDGIEAMKKLDKIRAIEREWGESRANSMWCMKEIAKILDEAKP